MNDLLSYTNDSKFERMSIRLFAVQGPHNSELASVETTLRNMSDISSIYSDSYANSNDRHVLDYEKCPNATSSTNWTKHSNDYFFKYPRLAVLVF